jgi:DNA-binding MarR family transcriptional regulator
LALADRHVAGLLAVRSDLADFERLGQLEAHPLGLTHVQHHVLLSLGGHPHPTGPRIADVARALGVASPSAVELVARMTTAGLLARLPDPADRRATRLHLTALGERLLHQLGENHLPRLRALTARAVTLLVE